MDLLISFDEFYNKIENCKEEYLLVFYFSGKCLKLNENNETYYIFPSDHNYYDYMNGINIYS